MTRIHQLFGDDRVVAEVGDEATERVAEHLGLVVEASSIHHTPLVSADRRVAERPFVQVIATSAIDAVHAEAWGDMVVLRGDEVITAPLSETVGKSRPVDMHLFHEVAEVFFG